MKVTDELLKIFMIFLVSEKKTDEFFLISRHYYRRETSSLILVARYFILDGPGKNCFYVDHFRPDLISMTVVR